MKIATPTLKAIIICSILMIIGLSSCQTEQPKKQDTETSKVEEDIVGQDMNKEEWVAHIFEQLTLEEKVRLTHASGNFTSGGVPRLGIADIVMSDGPHGVREYIDNYLWSKPVDTVLTATNFTSGIALAATWNPELAGRFGVALGKESKARGKEIQLGPAINIIRTPLGGRNFEYYSEDPHLISKLAVPMIQNVQAQGVASCVKHFAANNQEHERFTVGVEMSKRALHEIYLPGFKAAVLEGEVQTVMGAYNKLFGSHCTQNSYLLQELLKGDWGFEGIVMSDWDAVHETEEAHKNGLDIEMGTFAPWMNPLRYDTNFTSKYYHLGNAVIEGIEAGTLEVAPLDDKAKRILGLIYDLRIANKGKGEAEINTPAHKAISRELGQESIVLLKNDNNTLPIQTEKIKSIAVIGQMAIATHGSGGGSSSVASEYEITPLEGIQNMAKAKGVEVTYAPGDFFDSQHQSKQRYYEEAKEIASNSDVVVVVTGLSHRYESEGFDRASFSLPQGQDELIRRMLEVNKNVVVVITGSGAVDMNAWVNDVPSILQIWYGHQEGGNALADILFGDVSPSGKLPVTFPKKLTDCPAHANQPRTYPGIDGVVHYDEGILVGYRYYDAKSIEPQFSFGHGLSYTQFEYSEVSANVEDDAIQVSFQLKNTGTVAGKEVAQVYVSKKESAVQRAPKELKAFEKVALEVGEQKKITLTIPFTDLRYYDEKTDDWVMEKGKYGISIGGSSRDIRLTQIIAVE